jgi:GH24 family phage-related lysozyme (muramidase)
MNISQTGIDLIKSFEGLRLESYKAVSTEKHMTIGYGHYGPDVKVDQKLTKKQAEDLLKKDLKTFVDGVNSLVKVKVNSNQFDALVSFAYNCGLGALKTSTLLEKLNSGDYLGASKEFERWTKSGGKELKGLVTRRNKEKNLFLKPTSGSSTVSKPKTTTINYTIKLGDTLTHIAKKHNTTVSAIMKQNTSIKNADKIFAGQTIKIPK